MLNNIKTMYYAWQQKLKKHPNPRARKNQSDLTKVYFLFSALNFFSEISVH